MGTTGKCLVLAWCCGMLIAGGCAKQEVVAKDKPLAPPAAAAPSPSVPLWNKGDTTAAAAPRQRELTTEAVATPVVAGSDRQSASVQQEHSVAGLDRIYFDFDSAALSASARETLAQNAELLRKSSGLKVRIEGNCDERGSDEYNLALGERRARAAMQYLTTMGIAADRLSIISFGKEKPADAGHDEAAWAKNRRDEFVAVR